ncbi:MAG: phage holin family protein [Chthoniobacterales bacterium]
MTAPTDPGPPPAPQTGIAAEAMRLFASVTQHIQSLAALAGVEGREAVALYLKIAIALGVAIFFAAFGYIFVLLFLAFALVEFFHAGWLWISLGFAAAHLLGALIAALYVKKHCCTPVFRGISAEIRKDVAALRGAGNPPLM